MLVRTLLLCGFILSALVSTSVAQQEIYVEQGRTVESFKLPITTGAVSRASGLVAVTSADRKLKLFSAPAWNENAVVAALVAPLSSLSFSRDGQTLLSSAQDGQITYWNPFTGAAIRAIKAHRANIHRFGIGPESNLLVVGSDRAVKVVNGNTGEEVRSISSIQEDISSVAVQPDGRMFAISTSSGKVRAYNLLLLTQLKEWNVGPEGVSTLVFSPNGQYLVSGSVGGMIRLWETTGWTQISSVAGHRGKIGSLAFDPKGRWLASSAGDNVLQFYALPSLAIVKSIPLPDASFSFLAFLNDEILIAGDDKGSIRTWKVLEEPPDQEPPFIVITHPVATPGGEAPKVFGSRYEVRGFVFDASDVTVKVGHVAASLREAEVKDSLGRKGKEFAVFTELGPVGINSIEVRGVDAYGNEGTQSARVQRLSKEDAVEIVQPTDDSETEKVAIQVEFRTWFPIESYAISANLMDVAESRGPLRVPEGAIISEEVPLLMGYNQIQINVTSKGSERFRKVIGVTRKLSAVTTSPPIAKKSRGERPPGPQTWAVVVGVSEYASAGIPALKYADRDAEAFAGFLQTPEGGGYDNEHLRVLVNKDATLANVKDALVNFLRNAIDIDLVMIYFAGHGAPEPARPDNLYLLTHDTDPNVLATTAFPMWDIQTAISRYITAKRVVVFSDACHSGGISVGYATRGLDVTESNLINQYLTDLSRTKEGVVVFTASAAGEVSQEFPELGHGAFTYYLLEGMKGKADFNNDYTVTINELMQYVEEQVKRKTRGAQNPTRSQTAYDKELTISLIPH